MFKFMRKMKTLLFVCLMMTFAVPALAQNIYTVAGGGPNNVPALSANLDGSNVLGLDSSGNLYIGVVNGKVLRVDKNGVLTLLAGGANNDADNVLATSADACVGGGAVDGDGNVYILDNCRAKIRRVDAATGLITTYAGNGNAGTINTVGSRGDGGPAVSASLNLTGALALDRAGNLFIGDGVDGFSHARIRRVDATTHVITTVAGLFAGNIAVDNVGNLFVSNYFTEFVYRVDANTGAVTTVAGNGCKSGPFDGCYGGDGGPATSAALNLPLGMAVDGAGNLFIADQGNNRVRKVNAATQVITTVVGGGTCCSLGDGGPATSAQLGIPSSVALDSAGNLFIGDTGNDRIRRVDAATQIISTAAGNGSCCDSGEGGPGTSADLGILGGIALDNAGNLFVTTNYVVPVSRGRVRRVGATTHDITTVAGNEHAQSKGDGGPATSAELDGPGYVALDTSGNLFIVENPVVRRVDAATGVITTVAGNGTRGFTRDGGPAMSAQLDPGGIAVDGSGNLFIADTINHRIRRVDATTQIISTVAGTAIGSNGLGGFSGDGGPATSAELNFPSGVALDGAGNLFIADNSNFRIRRVDAATLVITTVAGNGTHGFSGDGGPAISAELTGPSGIAIDGAGNLFLADADNLRIRRVDAATGVITTVAGNGTYGFTGDGGPATDAEIGNPLGIAVDKAGNLFVADSGNGNGRIREVVASQQDTTPPVTAASASPSANTNGWNNTNVTVTLNSTDSETGGSGVKQIQYTLSGAQSLDTQTVPASTASVTISAEGMTTLNYFGTDNAGNAEQSKALTVQIDKTPPVVSGMPASGCTFWPPNNQMISVGTITAADALSGLAPGSFQLTASSNEPSDPSRPDVVITPNGSGGYAVQLRAARLGSGTGRIYTLQAAATDLAGNTVTSTATCTVPRDHSTAVPH